jgi:hypothetical protein
MGCGASRARSAAPAPVPPVTVREPEPPPAPAPPPPAPAPAPPPAPPPQPHRPSMEECRRWGVSLEGLEALAAQHASPVLPNVLGGVKLGATVADAVHSFIRPATTPEGWKDEVRQRKRVGRRRWYEHTYRELHTARGKPERPPGTRSYCELLREDASTAHHVGRPTVFWVHSWWLPLADMLCAARAFAATQRGDGGEEVYFWMDCFSLDTHALGAEDRQWWAATLRGAMAEIGHTAVMFCGRASSGLSVARPSALGELLATARCVLLWGRRRASSGSLSLSLSRARSLALSLSLSLSMCVCPELTTACYWWHPLQISACVHHRLPGVELSVCFGSEEESEAFVGALHAEPREVLTALAALAEARSGHDELAGEPGLHDEEDLGRCGVCVGRVGRAPLCFA